MRQRSHPICDHEKLGAFVKAARLKCGMTQGEIAEKLRQPISFVSKVESGTRQLQVLELLDILAALGIEPGQFLADFRSI